MRAINHELNTRKEEADNFIKFIERFETDESFFANIQESDLPRIDLTALRTSVKASAILMLYNAIESTMTNCLNKIHEVIKQSNLCYSQLKEPLKKIALIYYENAIQKCNDTHHMVEYRMKQMSLINGQTYFDLSYHELAKYYPMYSGNLDAKQIKIIFNRYGIPFEEAEATLKTIKGYRNHLAHGEQSFEEVGRTVSHQQLRDMHNAVFSYMEKAVEALSKYIQEEAFKLPDS